MLNKVLLFLTKAFKGVQEKDNLFEFIASQMIGESNLKILQV